MIPNLRWKNFLSNKYMMISKLGNFNDRIQAIHRKKKLLTTIDLEEICTDLHRLDYLNRANVSKIIGNLTSLHFSIFTCGTSIFSTKGKEHWFFNKIVAVDPIMPLFSNNSLARGSRRNNKENMKIKNYECFISFYRIQAIVK